MQDIYRISNPKEEMPAEIKAAIVKGTLGAAPDSNLFSW